MAIFASNRLLLTTLFATGLAVYFSPAEYINCFLSLSGIWNKLNEWNPNQSWICHHRFSTNQVSNNYHLLQFLCSSSPLGQSFVPSHCLAFGIHANVLPHWNSSGLQVPVQTKFMNGHYINQLKKWILHDHDRACMSFTLTTACFIWSILTILGSITSLGIWYTATTLTSKLAACAVTYCC